MKALGRKFDHNTRCDYCNHTIPRGKVAYEFVGQDVKAQGIYHGRICYEAALKKFETVQKEVGVSDTDINYEG